eukprot:3858481-Pyramimonas_sp.AAC.1
MRGLASRTSTARRCEACTGRRGRPCPLPSPASCATQPRPRAPPVSQKRCLLTHPSLTLSHTQSLTRSLAHSLARSLT